MAVIVTVSFPVSGLWVTESSLGCRCEIAYHDHTAWLELPSSDEDTARRTKPSADAEWTVEIPHVLVSIEMPRDLLAEDPETLTDSPGKFVDASRLGREAVGIAGELLSEVLTWARTDFQQFMIGPTYHPAETNAAPDMRDSTGRPFHYGFGGIFKVPYGHGREALDTKDLQAIGEKITRKEESSSAAKLLADARYYANNDHPNASIAVLMAAISSEVQIKTFLTKHYRPDQATMMEVLRIASDRPVLSPPQLYDKGLMLFLGRSLREDQQATYVGLNDLFKTRNQIAHGKTFDAEPIQVRRMVESAHDAANYLAVLARDLQLGD